MCKQQRAEKISQLLLIDLFTVIFVGFWAVQFILIHKEQAVLVSGRFVCPSDWLTNSVLSVWLDTLIMCIVSLLRKKRCCFGEPSEISCSFVSRFCEVMCGLLTCQWESIQYMMHVSVCIYSSTCVACLVQRDLFSFFSCVCACVCVLYARSHTNSSWGPSRSQTAKRKRISERFPSRYLKWEPCGTCLAFSSTHWRWPVIWSH